ncbi:MAG: hypothetical protein ACLT3Y_08405 [Ruminococcus callidus]
MRLEHGLLPWNGAGAGGFSVNPALMETARRRLAFDELLQLQLGMLLRRADNRRNRRIHAPGHRSVTLLCGTAVHHDRRAETRRGRDHGRPLRRCPYEPALQGDVGSGKTAVAAAACYLRAERMQWH